MFNNSLVDSQLVLLCWPSYIPLPSGFLLLLYSPSSRLSTCPLCSTRGDGAVVSFELRLNYSRILHSLLLILNDDELPAAPFRSAPNRIVTPTAPEALLLLLWLPDKVLLVDAADAPRAVWWAVLECKYIPWSRIFLYRLMYFPAAVVRGTMYFSQNRVLDNGRV